MGRWILENIINRGITPLSDNDHYGHTLDVCFKLRYEPSLVGRFTETPQLIWHERIVMKEHHTGTWWEHSVDQYQRSPTSRTLHIWPQRYMDAYESVTAMGGPRFINARRGVVRLLDQHSNPVAATDLRAAHTPDEQARAVRHYLKRHGNVLQIEMQDIPSIGKAALRANPAIRKERLLLFTLGVQGGNVWRMASQYLSVDAAYPEGFWHRDLVMEPLQRGAQMPSWNPAAGAPGPPTMPPWVANFFNMAGLVNVAPPVNVTALGNQVLLQGEYR